MQEGVALLIPSLLRPMRKVSAVPFFVCSRFRGLVSAHDFSKLTIGRQLLHALGQTFAKVLALFLFDGVVGQIILGQHYCRKGDDKHTHSAGARDDLNHSVAYPNATRRIQREIRSQ